MKNGVFGLLLLSLAFFSGCATIGRDFAAAQVPNIQLGKTTQKDIQAMFGTPWRTGMEDGKQVWTYGKYHYALFSQSTATDLVIRFNNNGVVYSYSYNTTEPQK